MRGGSLTRFRPDDQSGCGVRVGDFVSLVKRSTQGGLKGGWKGLKTGGPLELPNIPGGFRGTQERNQERSKASCSGYYQPGSQEETQ